MRQFKNLRKALEALRGTVPDVLVGARVGRGLTQEKLGEMVGVDKATIVRLESGETNISFEMFEKICLALRFKLIHFLQTASELIDFNRLSEKDQRERTLMEIKHVLGDKEYEEWRKEQGSA